MSSHRGFPLRVGDLVLLLMAVAVLLGDAAVVAYRGVVRQPSALACLDPPSRVTSDGSAESAAARVLRSVVSISAVGRSERVDGAGVVMSSDGTILTANHLVSDVAASGGQITVTLADGRTSPALLLGRLPDEDIAIVRTSRLHDLQPAVLASSAGLRIGQQVIVVGNPLGEAETVTAGIVSALDRTECTDPTSANGSTVPPPDPSGSQLTLRGLIQTDAHINPGSSGGALADLGGEVVGLVVMSRAPTGEGAGSVGIGFAIPMDRAYADAQRLLSSRAH